MSKKYTVVAVFQARAGKEAALREVLIGLLAPTRQEEGSLNYDLHASHEDAGKFLFYENWESQATHEAHMASAHVRALLKCVEDLCASAPEITCWEEL